MLGVCVCDSRDLGVLGVCVCVCVCGLSVTAGNWLSQHGGRSSTRRETVLPRWQKPYPPVCVVFTAW